MAVGEGGALVRCHLHDPDALERAEEIRAGGEAEPAGS